MENLEKTCVKFVTDNIAHIVKLNIDLTCLTSRLIKQIAAGITVEELDVLKDK